MLRIPNRLKKLSAYLRERLQPHDGPSPFVLRGPVAQAIHLTHYFGGRDATYVFVSRKTEFRSTPGSESPTIHFAPQVAGTAIIYDVTAGALQGKARPFVCDLSQHSTRIYAVMPYQIEGIRTSRQSSDHGFVLHVEFVDARQERIAAVLPLSTELCLSNGIRHKSRSITGESGVFRSSFQVSRGSDPCQLIVRSLLADWETTIKLEM
jgi:hypothetical protein